MGWVLPTGFEDPGSIWTSEEMAYDESTSSRAYTYEYTDGWSDDWLVLTHASMACDNIQIFAGDAGYTLEVELEVYDGAWHAVFNGALGDTTYAWNELGPFTQYTITKAQFKIRSDGTKTPRCYEVQFNEVVVAGIPVQAFMHYQRLRRA